MVGLRHLLHGTGDQIGVIQMDPVRALRRDHMPSTLGMRGNGCVLFQTNGRLVRAGENRHRDAGGVGLIRLAGIDPTADSGIWPSWASPRSG